MRAFLLLGFIIATPVWAAAPAKSVLTLDQYLDDVKSGNPETRSAIETIASYTSREEEAEVPLMTELYGEFLRSDDKKPTAQPIFMGDETQVTRWRAGLRKQTEFGLGADLFFLSQRTNISDASPSFMPINNYMESSATLQLTQSLWCNGFGEATRAKVKADRAENDSKLMESRYKLKTALLNARNAYWSVVSFNQIVKLQQENVERAKRLKDYMSRRAKLKLYDDTDALQAIASLETRELELQKSLDDRATAIRQLNTLRGVDSDEVQVVDELPTQEMMVEVSKAPMGHMTREDFEMLRANARKALEMAKYGKSNLQPKLDVIASVGTNGRDGTTGASYYQAGTDRYPTWSIGVNFSMPLDLIMLRDLNRGYNQAQTAADYMKKAADFNEDRVWDDLVKQKKEAQGRYERALSVEKIQTELVKRQRQRLLSGRTTTFETVNMEQTLALSQIQRVRNQLDLLQVHNSIKTFEAKP